MREIWKAFSDVVVNEQHGISVAYRCGNFVYEEGLRDGRWVALGCNASGYLQATNPIPMPSWLDYNAFPQPQSFDAVVDGQSLTAYLEYEGCDIQKDGDNVTARVTLRHTIRKMKVHICTKLDGTGILERRLELENTSDRPAAVSVAAPLAGGMQILEAPQFFMSERQSAYRLGRFTDSFWGHEGTFGWVDLPNDIYTVAGRYRRGRFRHPMFVLENRVTGECFIGQLGYSGGYAFTFDYKNENDNRATLGIRVDIDSPAPIRVLAPGECWSTPELHLGCVFGGLDNAINTMHRHIRKSVITHLPHNQCGWVQGAIGPEYDMSIESTLLAVESAHAVGAELFWIDASWYCPPFEETEWWNKAGDWHENRDRYPNGIREVREKCREYGMLFGMWVDAERIGPKSRVMQEHPEWVTVLDDGKSTPRGILNLTDPACAAWMENEIARIITEYDCDFYRLDYNVESIDMVLGVNEREGYLENNTMRHQQTVYNIYARLKKRFPNVVFENCAGGGGRTDLGMMRQFSETWITDWQLHPNSFRITNGMSMALPPEFINRLVGGQTAYRTADISMQMRNLMFCYPSIGGIKPNEAQHNPAKLAEIRHHVEIYKNFVRPFLHDSNIYHHTPELEGNYAKGFGILEMAARDGGRGILCVFQLAEPQQDAIVVYPRGIDPAKEYEVTMDNSGGSCVMRGMELCTNGIRVALPGALTSEMILYKAL